ncbi:hypothetical protein DYBT9623_05550 [Dyadobacter sp. CECT 9623]|uniref:Protein SCO1/2 n=1 Tax=Dyadobacter linearis TaxID=2823330 RepID=A0ABN7RFF5_9BACT|nr:SCO family protein [Dyadobacter sp. CECT 9623]CAG5075026.1 hypothetical protein DYBT9623_05550 [Dyadobacter sp. CECT 9623]
MKRARFIILAWAAFGCTPERPIPGEPTTVLKMVDGKRTQVAQYPKVPAFSFVNHKNQKVTHKDMDGEIYVADFFFTTCPTICPIKKSNMLKVYERFKDSPDVRILSHTIDPGHDTPEVLGQYAKDLGVKTDNWQFVTGEREKIYEIGQKHYMVSAGVDPDQPGGFIHSGAFILVNKDKHVRGMYDGTSELSTAQLIRDMRNLVKE